MENYLRDSDISLSNFAMISGVNSGSLSRILHGTKPMSMRELDNITAAMGLPEGYFFREYVEVCFYQSKVTWRRVRPFIYRCAELNKIDCIDKIVSKILEDLTYVPMLFDVAEDQFVKENFLAANVIYRGISESEKYQHSERLALCQYRLFHISLGEDLDSNYRAATLFEGYIDRLEVIDRLGAIVKLAHVFGALGRWNKVDALAQELYRIAQLQYELKLENNHKQQNNSRPTYYYILYSHLMRAAVCEEYGQYDQALLHTSLYADTSWIRENTKESATIIKQFKEWAHVNVLLYRLQSGELHVLPEYIEQIATKEVEVPVALYKILNVANRYTTNIDDVLSRFSSYISYRTIPGYSESVLLEQHAKLLIELGVYYLRNKPELGIETILQGLGFSVKINNDKNIIKCMTIFEEYRGLSTSEEENKYKYIVNEVKKLHEKNNYHSACSV